MECFDEKNGWASVSPTRGLFWIPSQPPAQKAAYVCTVHTCSQILGYFAMKGRKGAKLFKRIEAVGGAYFIS